MHGGYCAFAVLNLEVETMAVITVDGIRLEVPDGKMFLSVHWMREFISRICVIIRIFCRLAPAVCV